MQSSRVRTSCNCRCKSCEESEGDLPIDSESDVATAETSSPVRRHGCWVCCWNPPGAVGDIGDGSWLNGAFAALKALGAAGLLSHKGLSHWAIGLPGAPPCQLGVVDGACAGKLLTGG
jgi:hypothetical protein